MPELPKVPPPPPDGLPYERAVLTGAVALLVMEIRRRLRCSVALSRSGEAAPSPPGRTGDAGEDCRILVFVESVSK